MNKVKKKKKNLNYPQIKSKRKGKRGTWKLREESVLSAKGNGKELRGGEEGQRREGHRR